MDDDVVIKVAADISTAATALTQLVEQMGEMMKMLKDSGDETEEAEQKTKSFWETWVTGADKGTASGVLWGKQMSDAFDKAKKGITDLITSFPQMIGQATAAGDRFWTMSQRLNVSVEALAEMDYMAKQSGASMEGMARTVQGLGGILADSGGKGAKAIEGLGLNLAKLRKEKPDEAFFMIVEALQKRIPDATERSNTALKIFGNKFRGQTMLLNEDVASMRASFKSLGPSMTTEFGKASDRYNEAWTDIQVVQENFRNQVVSKVLPAITSLLEALPELGGFALTVASSLTSAAKALAPLAGQILLQSATGGKGLKGLSENAGLAGESIKTFATGSAASLAQFGSQLKNIKWDTFFAPLKDGLAKIGPLFVSAFKDIPGTIAIVGKSLMGFAGTITGLVMPALHALMTGLAALTSPVGLIVIAIGALLFILYKLMGGWDGVVAAGKGLLTFLQDLWTIIVGITKDAFGMLVSGIQGVVQWFKSLGESTAANNVLVQAFMVMFERLWGAAQKAYNVVAGVFKTLGQEVHALAESYRKEDEQQQKNTKSTEAGTEAYIAQRTAMEQSQLTVQQIGNAYKWLGETQDETVKQGLAAVKAGTQSAKEMGEALSATMGGSAEIWEKAIEKFKKGQEDLAKAAAKTPLAKLKEDTKELAQALRDAADAGTPMAASLEISGKKASELVIRAKGLKGEYDKLPQSIRDMGAAWDEQQFAEKTKAVTDKVTELVTAFSSQMTEGVRASAAAVQNMQDDMTASTLHGADARMFSIKREEKAALQSIDTQTKAVDAGMRAEISKVLAASADRRKIIKEDVAATAEASAVRLAIVEEDEAKAIAAIERTGDANRAGLQAQLVEIRAAFQQKRDLEDESLDYTEENQRALGIVTESMAEEAIEVEKRKIKAMKATNDPWFAEQIHQSELRLAQLEREADATERLLKEQGITSKKVAQERLAVERKKLADLKAMNDPFYRQQITAQKEVVDEAEVAAGKMVVDWGSALDSITTAFTQLATISGGTFGGMMKSIGEVAGSMNVMADSFGGAVDMFKGAGGLGGIKESFKGMGGSGGIGGVLSGLTQGLGTIMPMAGAIIGGVTAAVDIGKKLWDGFTESGGEKVAKEVGRKFGVTLTEEMGNAINDTAKDIFKGDRFAAEIYHMSDIIKEAGGVTADNFDKLLTGMTDVFTLVEKGTFTTEQATKVLEDNFKGFADVVVASGKVASAEFTKIITENARLGTQSKEIAEFVAGQSTRLGANLAKMVPEISSFGEKFKNLSEKQRAEIEKNYNAAKKGADGFKGTIEQFAAQHSKSLKGVGDDLARLERLTLASFNAAVAGGASYIEALDAMGPALDKIVEGNKLLGREGGAAVEKLLKFRKVANANKELVESTGALNEVMLALSNIGGLTVETMADLQAQGNDTFKELREAGFSEAQSLQQMKGFLEQVRNAHEELGLPIDANTQKLIDQAEGQGILAKKTMSANDVMMEGFGAIITALGGKIPEAFKKTAKAGVAAATTIGKGLDKNVIGTVEDTVDAVGGDVPDAFKKASKAGVTAATTVGKTLDKSVNTVVKNTSKEIVATPWAGYANAGVNAANLTARALDQVPDKINAVDKSLSKTDWEGWSDDAVGAAKKAQKAVDAVSLGSSPGGIKEIPLKLAAAVKAFKEWERTGVTSSRSVKRAVESVHPGATSGVLTAVSGARAREKSDGGVTAGDLDVLAKKIAAAVPTSMEVTLKTQSGQVLAREAAPHLMRMNQSGEVRWKKHSVVD